MQLPTLPADKANHVIYGALAFVVVGAPMATTRYAVHARIAGVLAAMILGAGKELSDWLANRRALASGQPAPHEVSGADFLATALGGLLAWAAAAGTV